MHTHTHTHSSFFYMCFFLKVTPRLFLKMTRISLGVYGTWLQTSCMSCVKLWVLKRAGTKLNIFYFVKSTLMTFV